LSPTKLHPPLIPIALIACAVLLTGCEFDNGIALRAKEKPEAYAKLQVWQKRFIEKGVIAKGFTSDMVYIAMGHPTKLETRELPEGHAELWSYKNYYPNEMQATMGGYRAKDYSAESPYQPQFKQTQDLPDSGLDPHSNMNPQVPVGMGVKPMPPSLFKAGPPQGGSMEPADLQSYTYMILFLNGRVVRFFAGYNP
jgi:hypothetical protein